MLASRSVQQGNHCVREEFLYELKAGPADGRRRRPSSRRQRRDGSRSTGLALRSALNQSLSRDRTHRSCTLLQSLFQEENHSTTTGMLATAFRAV
jgi:hypothetical protein